MPPFHLPPLADRERIELDELYRTTKDPRLRTRAQMVFLSADQHMKVQAIAPIVRESEATVRRWLKRYHAEGANGLSDEPRPGRRATVTAAYRQRLLDVVRRRPRSLELPFSLWTLQRLQDYMAEQTGIRVSLETVRQTLKKGGIVLSRPQHKITSPDPEYEVKKRRLKRRASS
jgi:transposase